MAHAVIVATQLNGCGSSRNAVASLKVAGWVTFVDELMGVKE